jgi:hypothetical protein
MHAEPTLLLIYVAILLMLIAAGVCFVIILRGYLRTMEKRRPAPPAPTSQGLSSSSLHQSIQSQVLELQATESHLSEHETRFRQLVQFLKETKSSMKAESSMLDLYILRLESLPHSDPGHLPTLAALFNWSQMRVKDLQNAKT